MKLGRIVGMALVFGIWNSVALGAGFEKTVTLSGRFGGMAGAGTALVEGAESIYFNPAGLSGPGAAQVALDFSPTFAKFSGFFANYNKQADSKTGFLAISGAMASYNLTDQLALGAGFYVSGGAVAAYENLDFSDATLGGSPNWDTLKPSPQSDIVISEYALGTSYQLIPGLKLGLAWRIVRVTGAYVAVTNLGSADLVQASINDLSATRFNGFKVGAQWTCPEKNLGFGASWRTPITFTAKGTSSSRTELSIGTGTATDRTGGPAEIIGTFPSQVNLGGFYDVMPQTWRLALEYSWTQYAVNRKLEVSGNIATDVAPTVPLPDIELGWHNEHVVRLGTEFFGFGDIVMRAGYAFTSKVSPGENAKATLASPGSANTFTLGAGTQFLDKAMELNGALEYAFASGTGTSEGVTSLVGGPATSKVTGEYKSSATTVHLGLSYKF